MIETRIKAEGGIENRESRRTNLMLAATVEADGAVIPVRIRNVSETGALFEGAGHLPVSGASIMLKRGEIGIPGTIAWSGGGRCGVKFDNPTPVQGWTGGKPQPIDCTGLRDQRRVDALQAEYRSGRAPHSDAALSEDRPLATPDIHARLAEELRYVQRLLEGISDQLIEEPILVQRHARTLQGFDLASQILGHVATIVAAEDRSAAVEAIGMEDLRARLKRKSI